MTYGLNGTGWRTGLLALVGSAALAMAPPPDTLTLLVIPARYSVAQVAFDLQARFPVVLVSYQGEPEDATPYLHYWNGVEWVHITPEDFAAGRFLDRLPLQTVLVGDETIMPTAVVDAVAWSPALYNVAELSTPGLINALGVIVGFRDADWRWFAARYSLGMEDIYREQRRDSWYAQRYDEVFVKPEVPTAPHQADPGEEESGERADPAADPPPGD